MAAHKLLTLLGLSQDTDEAVAPATSPTARWLFLDASIETWFVHQLCQTTTTATHTDPRFETFLVHAPEIAQDQGINAYRSRWKQVLYATELVAYMLTLDKATWWYANRRKRPSCTVYDPSQFDPSELKPTVTFVVHPLGVEDDTLDAVQHLHKMLLDTDPDTPPFEAYAAAKRQILEIEDSRGRLGNFKIPTRIKLQPPLPANADELRVYLLDAIAFARAFHRQSESRDSPTPFYFEALTLSVYTDFLCDVRNELRELLSLGVPVTLALRHQEIGGRVQGHWTRFQRPNLFSVVACDPGTATHASDDAIHSLESAWVSRGCEFWSAVAYSSTLRHVSIQFADTDGDEQVSRWMAYALAHSASLQGLEIRGFRMNAEDMDAFQAVLTNPIPSSVLLTPPTEQAPVQLIRLKPDATIACPRGVIGALEDLQIPNDWQFPVVRTTDETQTIQFIVPGHAIGETPLTSVASYHDVPDPSRPLRPTITSLVIQSDADDPGDLGRFVELVGHELRTLHWRGEDNAFQRGDNMQPDLEAIVRACPHLESLTIDHNNLESLVPLSSLPHLRTLRLEEAPVSTTELIAFFRLLQDETAPLVQTLERFSFYCPSDSPLSHETVDVAFEMLSTNRRLYSVTLGLEHELVDEADARFEPLRSAELGKEPLRTKLALLSVVQQYRRQQPLHPLGKLDQRCVANVLQCLGGVAKRRIQLIKCDVMQNV